MKIEDLKHDCCSFEAMRWKSTNHTIKLEDMIMWIDEKYSWVVNPIFIILRWMLGGWSQVEMASCRVVSDLFQI